jgi:hypothetical protein
LIDLSNLLLLYVVFSVCQAAIDLSEPFLAPGWRIRGIVEKAGEPTGEYSFKFESG